MTASLLAKFTYLLFLSLPTANLTSDRLRKELREAFLRWIPIRRRTKETLEHLERVLMPKQPRFTTRTIIGCVLSFGGSAAFAAPLTFGTSLMVAAAAAGIGVIVGADASQHPLAEDETIGSLAEVQGAIERDRRACSELREQLDSFNRTFTSTTSAGATVGTTVRNVSDALKRFADSNVLPENITQFVKSSLDRHRGLTRPVVEEIRNILDNLECPDEAVIERLLRRVWLTDAEYAEV